MKYTGLEVLRFMFTRKHQSDIASEVNKAMSLSLLFGLSPGKAGPGTTRFGRRLGCSSGIHLGKPWMTTWVTSNFESVTSSTVAMSLSLKS